MIIVTRFEFLAFIAIMLIGFVGIWLMCEANLRQIKLLRYLINEHDQRIRTLEREEGIENWTSDGQQ